MLTEVDSGGTIKTGGGGGGGGGNTYGTMDGPRGSHVHNTVLCLLWGDRLCILCM